MYVYNYENGVFMLRNKEEYLYEILICYSVQVSWVPISHPRQLSFFIFPLPQVSFFLSFYISCNIMYINLIYICTYYCENGCVYMYIIMCRDKEPVLDINLHI